MSKTTKTFDREYLKDELGLPGGHGTAKIVEDNIIGHSRWSVDHSLVFQEPGQAEDQAWVTTYSRGATESQEEGPWENEEQVECTLVRRVEKTVTVWE